MSDGPLIWKCSICGHTQTNPPMSSGGLGRCPDCNGFHWISGPAVTIDVTTGHMTIGKRA